MEKNKSLPKVQKVPPMLRDTLEITKETQKAIKKKKQKQQEKQGQEGIKTCLSWGISVCLILTIYFAIVHMLTLVPVQKEQEVHINKNSP